MTAVKRALAIMSCLVVAACAGSNYTQKEDLMPTGSAFTKALHRGYVSLAWSEGSEADWRDSERFADKAKAAGQGNVVDPENLSNWAIPSRSARMPRKYGSRRGS